MSKEEISKKLEDLIQNLAENENGRKANQIELNFRKNFTSANNYLVKSIAEKNKGMQKVYLYIARMNISAMQKNAKKLKNKGRLQIANQMAKMYNSLRKEYLK